MYKNGSTASPTRQNRRGAVLIMVMVLLIVLALIGISFSYLVIVEARSAENQANRFRATSASKDGMAYAVARLRSESLARHYEGEGQWSFNSEFEQRGGRIVRVQPGTGSSESHKRYLERYASSSSLDHSDEPQTVSYSRSYTTSNLVGAADNNWIDKNGNGRVDKGETELAQDLVASTGSRSADEEDEFARVSYFVGDGIDQRVLPGSVEGGTYRELGDRARLKIIDTNAQLNLNDYSGDRLVYMLTVLGEELEKIAKNARGINSQKRNPFPKERAKEIAEYQELNFGTIPSKSNLRDFFNDDEIDLYNFAMDFVCVQSFPNPLSIASDNGFTYDQERNPVINRPVTEDDRKIFDDATSSRTANRPFYESYYLRDGGSTLDPRDGDFSRLPEGARASRSPVNVNTVTKPVLTALIAGIEARARFLVYENSNIVMAGTEAIQANRDTTGAEYHNTDAGALVPGEGSGYHRDENYRDFSANGIDNTAQYQLIPIGPIAYTNGGNVTPDWKDDSAGNSRGNPMSPLMSRDTDHAANLADLIIEEREANGPYQSWMDFEYRILILKLEGFNETQQPENPDLLATGRRDINENIGDFSSVFNRRGFDQYFPDPSSARQRHPLLDGTNITALAHNKNQIYYWYWRACVDMLRANFAPDGLFTKLNPDAAIYATVDSTDLTYSTAPMCFSSMGVYEIVSQGEITRATFSPSVSAAEVPDFDLTYPVASRTMRSVVEVYSVYTHSTQEDFISIKDADSYFPGQNDSQRRVQVAESVDALTVFGTMTHPNSFDLGRTDLGDKVLNGVTTDIEHLLRTPLPPVNKDKFNIPTSANRLVGGAFGFQAMNTNFGWVTLYPQDRTPVKVIRDLNHRLNFHAPFNASLVSAYTSLGNQMKGSRDAPNWDGVAPMIRRPNNENRLNDSLSTATPTFDRIDADPYFGFEEWSDYTSAKAAENATLRPDGVLLRSWHLSPLFKGGQASTPPATYGLRELNRPNRLTILRYRNGVATASSAFSPIAAENPKESQQTIRGDIEGEDPDLTISEPIAIRLFGMFAPPGSPGSSASSVMQGTDSHNIERQRARQDRANVPYYEGWIDFWIKWELPPVGNRSNSASYGEIDPASGNLSGLVGATSFGRYMPSHDAEDEIIVSYSSSGNASNNAMGPNTDFEGSQIFVFKEPSGILRVSHVYFSQAFTVNGWQTAAGKPKFFERPTGQDDKSRYRQVGNLYRVFGKPDSFGAAEYGLDGLIGTNDIFTSDLSGGPLVNDTPDLGFAQSRTESFWNLNTLSPTNNGDIVLLTHNWYRFTLQYRNNYYDTLPETPFLRWAPHNVYIDGKRLDTPNLDEFQTIRHSNSLWDQKPDPTPTGNGDRSRGDGGYNWGMTYALADGVSSATDGWKDAVRATGTFNAADYGNRELLILRAANVSSEVDPEDMLTVGCIYRRQRQGVRQAIRTNDDDAKGLGATLVPIFRFSSRVAAPANATIDDFRISGQSLGDNSAGTYSEDDYAAFSRFEAVTGYPGSTSGREFLKKATYQNGFVAQLAAGDGLATAHFPVKAASLRWVEWRPRWDPYKARRFDHTENHLKAAPHVAMAFEAVDDIKSAQRNKMSIASLTRIGLMTNADKSNVNYWAAGGASLQPLAGDINRPVWLQNKLTAGQGETNIAYFRYAATFVTPSTGPYGAVRVLNTTPVLDRVELTVLTPPRILNSEEVIN